MRPFSIVNRRHLVLTEIAVHRILAARIRDISSPTIICVIAKCPRAIQIKPLLFLLGAIFIKYSHALLRVFFLSDGGLEALAHLLLIFLGLLLNVKVVGIFDLKLFYLNRDRLPYTKHVGVGDVVNIIRTCGSQDSDSFENADDELCVERAS